MTYRNVNGNYYLVLHDLDSIGNIEHRGDFISEINNEIVLIRSSSYYKIVPFDDLSISVEKITDDFKNGVINHSEIINYYIQVLEVMKRYKRDKSIDVVLSKSIGDINDLCLFAF